MSSLSSVSSTTATTPLYGGAITIPKLPQTFIDVSQIRQVPDTQEVFINQIPDNTTSPEVQLCYDQSLIIDLLEQVNSIEYAQAIAEHMQDIVPAHVHNQPLEEIQIDGVTRYFSYVVFTPEYKRKEETGQAEKIVMFICLIRLVKVETDVIVQFNVPFKSKEGVSDKLNIQASNHECGNGNHSKEKEVNDIVNEKYAFFKNVCTGFKVRDWNLFG